MPERLDFSRSLYDRAAVDAAVQAYAELASFTVEEAAHEIGVVISEPHPDVPDLAHHFANHVLHATVSRQRRAAEGLA